MIQLLCSYSNDKKAFLLVHTSFEQCNRYRMLRDFRFIKFFEFDMNSMKYMGIKPLGANSKYSKLYSAYSLVLNVFFSFIFVAVQILSLVFQSRNLKQMAACLYMVTTCLNGFLKSFYLNKNKKLLWAMLSRMDDRIFRPNNDFQMKSAIKSLSLYTVTKRVLLIICTAAVFSSIITPR